MLRFSQRVSGIVNRIQLKHEPLLLSHRLSIPLKSRCFHINLIQKTVETSDPIIPTATSPSPLSNQQASNTKWYSFFFKRRFWKWVLGLSFFFGSSIATYIIYRNKRIFENHGQFSKAEPLPLEDFGASETETLQDALFTVDYDNFLLLHLQSPWYPIYLLLQNAFQMVRLVFRVAHLTLLFAPAILTFPFSGYFFEPWCDLLVFLLERGGPCFIKLGQWAATRPDLFNEIFCEHMSKMHSNAPTHSFYYTKRVIQNSYGKSIDEIFDSFDTVPLASGAIAQVYRAKLKGSDVECAVKVRHPKAQELIFRDLYILKLFTKMVGSIPAFKWLNLEENIKSFSQAMKDQTDLRIEAQNLKQFKKNFENFNSVIFPEPSEEYPAKRLILIESFESGIPVDKYVSKEIDVKLRAKIADLITDLYLKMMLIDNFVHGDLHPGNLLVKFKDRVPYLVVLDAGLVSQLSARDRRNFLDLFQAVASGDGYYAADLMITRSRNYQEIAKNKENLEGFRREMTTVISQVIDKPLREVEIGKILNRVLAIGRKYKVSIESNFTTLVIGTIVIEGLGRQLNPDFNFIEAAKPYLFMDKGAVTAFIKGRLNREEILTDDSELRSLIKLYRLVKTLIQDVL